MNRALLRFGSSVERIISKSRANKFLATRELSSQTTKQPEDSEDMDQMKNNPYFEKYKNKLKAVYDEDPNAFTERLQNKKVEKIGNPEDYGIDVNGSKMVSAVTKKKTLDGLIKLDKVKDLEPEAIKAIWITFLSEIHKFPGMITADEYEKIAVRSKEFPTFLLPLPREEGYEFILAQWNGPECHFTPLINFQAHGENAPTTMTTVYFDELLESKKISLEMSEVDQRHLNVEEARFLIHVMKQYYVHSAENDKKHQLMRTFNKDSNAFRHMDLIDELKADNLSLEQFREIIDIRKATEGVLEPVTPPAERKAKAAQASSEDRAKSSWVRSEVKKEKDLADFS